MCGVEMMFLYLYTLCNLEIGVISKFIMLYTCPFL